MTDAIKTNFAQQFYHLDDDLAEAHQVELTMENGELEHDIDLSGYNPKERRAIESELEKIATRMDALKEKARTAADEGRGIDASEYDAELDRLSARVTRLKVQLESGEFELTGSVDGQAEASADELGSATGADSGAGDAEAKFDAIMDDIPGAVEQFETDPKAFFDELKGLGSARRAEVMAAIQNEIQSHNQLMSMLTNFQQAMHDTQKAIISNLRV